MEQEAITQEEKEAKIKAVKEWGEKLMANLDVIDSIRREPIKKGIKEQIRKIEAMPTKPY
jgi:hypothetical protein